MTFDERRQGRRVDVLPHLELRLDRTVRVQVIDLSTEGMLLASSERIPPGTAGQLRTILGARRFEAVVVVKREEVRETPAPFLLGAGIVSAPGESRQALEEFLRRSR